jgi:hypothetical protein
MSNFTSKDASVKASNTRKAKPGVIKPDLTESRRLLDAGMHLIEMMSMTKRPIVDAWNTPDSRVESISDSATGYGLPLGLNKMVSVDPDNNELAVIGMRALGFDLEAIMAAGCRTVSTRTGSGGRSAFAEEPGLKRIVFSGKGIGTVLELRAGGFQDTIPGIVYTSADGEICTQRYATERRYDDLPGLPDDLLTFWQRCVDDLDFLHAQQQLFFAALPQIDHAPVQGYLSISGGRSGEKLAFAAPGVRGQFNRENSVEGLLAEHGYRFDAQSKSWTYPGATGKPGIHPIPLRDGLWRSHHAGDPLCGTFDAWSAHVVLNHGGVLARAVAEALPARVGSAIGRVAKMLDMSVAEFTKAAKLNKTAIAQIIANTAFSQSESKYTTVTQFGEIRKFTSGNVRMGLTVTHGQIFVIDKLTELAEAHAESQGLTAAKTKAFVSSVVNTITTEVCGHILVEKQYINTTLAVDMFATKASLQIAGGAMHMTLPHAPFPVGEINARLLADYKEHFPQLDEFIEMLVAARFAGSRKAAYLWVNAVSDWGKGFITGCMGRLGLVVELSVEEAERAFSGAPVGKTFDEFRHAWVLSFNEFKKVRSEIKQLEQSMRFSPKGLPTVSVQLYLKLFWSAEVVESLASEATGIEDQFANRISKWTMDGTITSRELYTDNPGEYMDTVTNYLAQQLNAAVEQYRAMGLRGAGDCGTHKVKEFHARNGIALGVTRLSDMMAEHSVNFMQWVIDTYSAHYRHDHTLGTKRFMTRPQNDLLALCHEKNGEVYLQSPKKAIRLWMDNEFNPSEIGTMIYKVGEVLKLIPETKSERFSFGKIRVSRIGMMNHCEGSARDAARDYARAKDGGDDLI